MDRWNQRVALVTGASAGIGRDLALCLASHNMKVVACARRLDRLEEMRDLVAKSGKGEILPIKCDVSNDQEIMEMFQKIRTTYGRLDICVNNAGVLGGLTSNLLNTSNEEWKQLLNVNVLALSICTRESVRLMDENNIDDGHIIHISSMLAHRQLNGEHFPGATKVAVKYLTEGLRRELRSRKSNIRVTCISPAVVDTDMSAHASGFKKLTTNDITNSVIHVISQPPHVEIHDILLRSVEQIS